VLATCYLATLATHRKTGGQTVTLFRPSPAFRAALTIIPENMNHPIASCVVIAALCFAQSGTAQDMSAVVADGAKLELVADGCKFTEGPAADSAGNVYFTDQPNDRIVRIATDGVVADFMKPAGRSNGMFFANDGKLIACADDKNEMWSIDIQDKTHTILFDDHDGKMLNGPNDVWVHPSGVMFFTDPFYKRPWWTHDQSPQDVQALYRVAGDGAITRQTEPFEQPNGIVGDAKRGLLYVADIGDKKTYQYPILGDGTLGQRMLFCEEGSDGMTLDDAGNLYLTGKQGVTVYTGEAEKIGVIEVPENWTANVCFGGTDHKTLFVTASDSVYSIAMKTRGISDQK